VFVYGPVPSRRLGRSLGVSIIPHKVCTHSCVYCQLGATRLPRIEPKSYYYPDRVLGELDRRISETSPDCITFVGDGEPTLCSDLGWYIRQCKARWSLPVAVITNGALLFREEIRRNLFAADIVLPSLDAGDRETFERINRPHRALDFEQVVRGLILFREAFSGQIRLEVMLVKGVNDSDEQLKRIRKLAWAIRPERIDVAIPTRPPTERWVEPPDPDRIIKAQRLLRSAETMTLPENGPFELAGFGTLREALIGLSLRHPLRWDQAKQVEEAFGQPERLEHLVNLGALAVVEYGQTRFVAPPTRPGAPRDAG